MIYPMHDWYLGLLASAFGNLVYIDEPAGSIVNIVVMSLGSNFAKADEKLG